MQILNDFFALKILLLESFLKYKDLCQEKIFMTIFRKKRQQDHPIIRTHLKQD